MTIDMKSDMKLDWAFSIGCMCDRPGLCLPLTSLLSDDEILFSRACHVHSRASACIRVYSRALACVYLYRLDADYFQPGFYVFRKKSFLSRASRASRALLNTCLVLSHPLKYIHVHLRASTCIHMHPRRSCV